MAFETLNTKVEVGILALVLQWNFGTQTIHIVVITHVQHDSQDAFHGSNR